jgi:hypothetical protein
MEKLLDDLKNVYRAQEGHGFTTRRAGDIAAARRYFARAEAYAFSAAEVARLLGRMDEARELYAAESVNFRRATNPEALAHAPRP